MTNTTAKDNIKEFDIIRIGHGLNSITAVVCSTHNAEKYIYEVVYFEEWGQVAA